MYDREGRPLQPRDIAMRQIVKDNFGKRPIYFAVTIPQENMADFEDYLVLEGLAKRFVGERGRNREEYAKIEHNATQVFRYDGVLAANGKRDDTIYASSFIRLGQYQEQLGDAARLAGAAGAGAEGDPERPGSQSRADEHYRKAVAWYLRGLEFSPDLDVLQATLGALYAKMGDMDAALQLFERLARKSPQDERWRFRLAGALLMGGRVEDGLRELQAVLAVAPDDEYVVETWLQALWESGRHAEAERALAEWEARHTGNTSVRQFLEAVKSGSVERLVGPQRTPAGAPATP
jgi:tetratricopeptide (TPR) repeat protein